MRLSLIGMSGSGKSYWARELAKHGFRHYCCDALIAAKLAPALTRPDGTTTTLGEWMGFPYQPQYRACEARYLARDIAVVTEILQDLSASADPGENVVVDTTGSVIYTGEETLSKLRQYTTVVYLATPPEAQEEMLRKYIANMRPVLWRGLFHSRPGETNEEALVRCYPILLSSRERLYAQCADVTIGYYEQHEEGFDVRGLLRMIPQP
jgi:shikimate kinase